MGTTPEYLLDETENKTPTVRPASAELVPVTGKLLKLVGYVEAGVWREAVQIDDDEQRTRPVQESPAFDGFDQYLLQVVGRSMDMFYQPGALLHCVELDYGPRHIHLQDGDHVIVQREVGGKVETTVKELEGGRLWPRSTDPRFDGPVQVGVHEEETVSIKALVISSIAPRPNLLGR